MENFLQGGLPPLPGAGLDFTNILLNMVFAVLWSIVAAVGFAVAIAIGLQVMHVLTPAINEWEEIRRGNMAVAVLWSAIIASVAIVVFVVLSK
jgi:uncharacterized membrane protein YjfL (UPF0719 family)